MVQPYVGEIRLFAGNFAPAGWAFCAGQLVAITENETLFNLIGTTYGGDGQSTFQLPDLQGRVPAHMGSNGASNYVLAEKAGVETVTLTTQQIPIHNHLANATATGQQVAPSTSTTLAQASGTVQGLMTYAASQTPNTPINPQSVVNAGGSQPHDNLQPYLCVSFIISLFGVFPTQ
ncbi:MAG TPA: tail fiber protein [Rhizomicrobium sp.]|jgi:microcystin-dependent protein